jgi:inorganic pyrophosphatase/exopolyphosphatase
MRNFSLIVSIKLLDPYPVTIAQTLSSVQSPFHWPTVDNNEDLFKVGAMDEITMREIVDHHATLCMMVLTFVQCSHPSAALVFIYKPRRIVLP